MRSVSLYACLACTPWIFANILGIFQDEVATTKKPAVAAFKQLCDSQTVKAKAESSSEEEDSSDEESSDEVSHLPHKYLLPFFL